MTYLEEHHPELVFEILDLAELSDADFLPPFTIDPDDPGWDFLR